MLAEPSPIGQMRLHRQAPDTRVECGDRPEAAGNRPASPTGAQALRTRGSDIAVPWRAASSSRGKALEQQSEISLETGERACELGDRALELLGLFAQFVISSRAWVRPSSRAHASRISSTSGMPRRLARAGSSSSIASVNLSDLRRHLPGIGRM
jgi:hypothetical protein